MKNKTKKQKPTKSKFSILRQICNWIPNHLVPKLARETKVEQEARTPGLCRRFVAPLLLSVIPFPTPTGNAIPRWRRNCFGRRWNTSRVCLRDLLAGDGHGSRFVLKERSTWWTRPRFYWSPIL